MAHSQQSGLRVLAITEFSPKFPQFPLIGEGLFISVENGALQVTPFDEVIARMNFNIADCKQLPYPRLTSAPHGPAEDCTDAFLQISGENVDQQEPGGRSFLPPFPRLHDALFNLSDVFFGNVVIQNRPPFIGQKRFAPLYFDGFRRLGRCRVRHSDFPIRDRLPLDYTSNPVGNMKPIAKFLGTNVVPHVLCPTLSICSSVEDHGIRVAGIFLPFCRVRRETQFLNPLGLQALPEFRQFHIP